jgi:small subunit ribosomal protein S20
MEIGDVGEAETAVTEALSLLDKAVQKGVLHKNTASRGKSRLSVRLNRLKEASPA